MLHLVEADEKCVLVEIDAAVGELAEGSSLLDLSGLFGVLEMRWLAILRSSDGYLG